ncbi:hypothetical protein Tco_0397673 [Tanacetum coccineum]
MIHKVTPSDIQHSAAYPDLRVLQIGLRAKVIENQVKTVMSSASSAVTYTSVYTDSEPGRAFWGADDEEISEGGIPRVIILGYDGLPIQPVAPPSPDYIPGPEDPQTPPVPQDEDEREPMFVQAHDPDYVPEPIYPEYIPLEDEHEFPAEEQPLPPVDSPTAESPGYVTESDPEEDPEEYEDDETEDDEDEDDEDEEEEHLAPADSAIVVPVDEPVFPPEGTEPVIPPPSTDITIGVMITIWPQTSISLPPEAEVERLLAMTTPSPSLPISLSPPSAGERLARCMAPPAHSLPLLPSSGCPTQIQTLRIASTQALIDAVTTALPSSPLPPLPPSLYIPPPVDRRDDITESEQPPRKRLYLSTLGSKYKVGESSTARPTRGRGIDYRFVSMVYAEERRHGIRDVGYGIRDTWVDPAEAVPEIAPMTMVEEEAYASREAWAYSIGLSQTTHQELQTHHDHVYAHETHLQAHQTQLQLQSTLIQTQHQVQETRFQMQQAELAAFRETDHRRQAQMSSRGELDSQDQRLGFQITRMLLEMLTATSSDLCYFILLDGSHSSHEDNRRHVQTARPCYYADFMKCQPLNFKGTEGVVGLTRWIEKMESVFNISGCAIENQVKFATCTLLGTALTWWNGQIRTLGPEAYAMTWEVLKKMMMDKYCPATMHIFPLQALVDDLLN